MHIHSLSLLQALHLVPDTLSLRRYILTNATSGSSFGVGLFVRFIVAAFMVDGFGYVLR